MYSQSNCHTHNTNCMYVPKTSLHRASPSPDHRRLLRARRIGKEMYFSVTFCVRVSNRYTRASDTVAFDDRRSS